MVTIMTMFMGSGLLGGRGMKFLEVSANTRYLQHSDGSPFFWMGDTAWELFHALDRDEAQRYLANRAERRFNVIQAVALAEFDGIRSGNAYGHRPFLQNQAGQFDPAMPDTSGYWDHVDFIVNKAEELDLYIGFLPTWGDKYNQKWGKGPEIFTPENAQTYGCWLGERYKDKPNIVWILGGDRPLENDLHRSIVRAMAEGLREGDGGSHLMTFHPPGGTSSSAWVHQEDWVDFHMIQSGHGLPFGNYRMVAEDYVLDPVRPTLDGEPRYEDHPINFKPENGFFRDADVRQALYWAVFAGGAGVTYGHHCVWSMTTEPSAYFPMTWQEAIDRPGAGQVRHLRKLMESRPFATAVPDSSMVLTDCAELDHVAVLRGDGFAMFYSPTGQGFTADLSVMNFEKWIATWYDPRSGEAQIQGEFHRETAVLFAPPTSGRGQDWVLVLDDANEAFPQLGAFKAI